MPKRLFSSLSFCLILLTALLFFGLTAPTHAALDSGIATPSAGSSGNTPALIEQRIVHGSVTAADTGEPLAGIKVIAYDWICSGHWGCFLDPVTSTQTAVDGTYEFIDLPSADELEAIDPTGLYAEAMFPAYHYPEPGETVVADVALRTAVSVYGWIKGRVTDTTGHPASEIAVDVYRLDAAGNYYSSVLNAAGEYNIRVTPGSYRVFFGGSYVYIREYYDDAATEKEAVAVTARVGEVTTVDASLRTRGRFTGRITDTAGNPIRGVSVRFYRAPWVTTGHFSYRPTDEDGRYTSPYLDDGEYRVDFHADGYKPAVWGGGVNITTGANIIVKADTVVEGINVALTPIKVPQPKRILYLPIIARH